MVVPAVAQFKRDQLIKDGAIVQVIEPITEGLDWIKPDQQELRWRDQMSKLHLFKMDSYDRVLFIDGDTILHRCLDGLFAAGEPNTTVQRTGRNEQEIKSDEAQLPDEYLMASVPEVWGKDASYPPSERDFTVSLKSTQR